MKQTDSTKSVKIKEISRKWHLINVKDSILGRVAPEISKLLQGKHKSNYVSYLDSGDYVVVVNASKVKLSGRKQSSKTYSNYNAYDQKK